MKSRPLLALQQKRKFLPQTVPAYSAHQYVAQLQKEYPEYSYREATLNPTNPADRATEWEADVVAWFRNHEEEKELIGQRETPTGPSLYLARPIRITDPSCLTCHSTPAEAPPTMIDAYGTANGFGWKLNEIVGAQIVAVPMSLPLQRANETLIVVLGVLAAVFLLIFILLNILLNIVVINPIKQMSAKANEDNAGGFGCGGASRSAGGRVATCGAIIQPHASQFGQRREHVGRGAVLIAISKEELAREAVSLRLDSSNPAFAKMITV